MKTYLLTWNPKRSNWDNDIGEMADAVKNGGTTETTWSCGNTKSIQEGDRIFFIQLGVSKKGIFASGKAIKGSYEDSHWETERAERGETCRFIKVQFDRLLDPDCDTILSREILKLPPFDSVHWDTQASGIRIADSVAIELEKLWRQYAGIAKYNLSDLPVPTYISEQLETEIIFPDEIVAIKSFYEGAVSQVTVNVYERDPQARKACIEHYGLNCHVCDFNFEQVYGERGAGFIHVHHLRPVSEGEYNLNPVDDLRPVCPNCHAMIHRYGLLSIEELKILINRK